MQVRAAAAIGTTCQDLTVAIRFQGRLRGSYTAGDNSDVLPTDTMKNTVYALAAQEPVGEPETFGCRLARHFLDRSRGWRRCASTSRSIVWRRMAIGGREHGHAFVRSGPEVRTATVQARPRRQMIDRRGVADLMILKSAHSAFTDSCATSTRRCPRPPIAFSATSLTATWQYDEADVEFGPLWQRRRQTLLEVFAEHDSQSVQHTLYAMGQAVLERVADHRAIRLVMPNKHHLPVDLSLFGLENRNEIFVADREPYGLIEATLVRDAQGWRWRGCSSA